MMAGVLFGYQSYDTFHYFMHHAELANPAFVRRIKIYHMLHHYKSDSLGFGVSQKFWDIVFNTEIKS